MVFVRVAWLERFPGTQISFCLLGEDQILCLCRQTAMQMICIQILLPEMKQYLCQIGKLICISTYFQDIVCYKARIEGPQFLYFMNF